MAFIIDTYNRYDRWDREHAKYVFEINEVQYAVKEVQMDWGLPLIRERTDREIEAQLYYVYDTIEDAMKFVKRMQRIAR